MKIVQPNWHPDRRQLRVFGLVCLAGFALIGAWIYTRHSFLGIGIAPSAASRVALALWVVGLACGVLGAVGPGWLRPLYVGLTLVALPIGYAVSLVLLALLYYGLITPVGLVFRLVGRDPLERGFDEEADTYWVRRQDTADVTRYFRQF
ncbi:MAG: hypothetical protein PVJ27_07345 [Candidatus Brocadiaceae bacterium]|jgi:hypothetical protein